MCNCASFNCTRYGHLEIILPCQLSQEIWFHFGTVNILSIEKELYPDTLTQLKNLRTNHGLASYNIATSTCDGKEH